MDSERIELNPEAIQHIQGIIRKFDGTTDFTPDHKRNQSGVNYLKSDFLSLVSLACIARTTGTNVAYWENAVEERHAQNKNTAFEYGDRLTALEIDEDYCFYLFNSGETDRAIEFAQRITDGYMSDQLSPYSPRDAMEEIAYELEQRQFEEKPQRILERMISKLIRQGDLQKAEEILLLPIMFEYDKLEYLGALTEYYTQQNDIEKLRLVHDELRQKMSFSDDDILFRAYRADSDSIVKYHVQEFVKNGDVFSAVEKAGEVEVPYIRIKTKISLIPELIKHDTLYTRNLIQDLITEIGEQFNVSKEAEEDIVYNSNLTSRGNLLIQIVENIINESDFQDMVTQCIQGTSEQMGVVDCIQKLQYPTSLAQNFFVTLAKGEDRMQLAAIYDDLCNLLPERRDDMKKVYALLLAEKDTKAAEDLILSIEDPEIRKDAYYTYVNNGFQSGRLPMSQWSQYVQNYKNLEDAYLKPEVDLFNGEFSLHDILNAPEEAEEKQERVISFGSFAVMQGGEIFPKKERSEVQSLLAYLAEHAGMRGYWKEFSEILNDPRITPYITVRVLSTLVKK